MAASAEELRNSCILPIVQVKTEAGEASLSPSTALTMVSLLLPHLTSGPHHPHGSPCSARSRRQGHCLKWFSFPVGAAPRAFSTSVWGGTGRAGRTWPAPLSPTSLCPRPQFPSVPGGVGSPQACDRQAGQLQFQAGGSFLKKWGQGEVEICLHGHWAHRRKTSDQISGHSPYWWGSQSPGGQQRARVDRESRVLMGQAFTT